MARPRTVSKLVYEDKETGCHIIEYADVGHIVSRFLCPGEKQSTEVFCKKGVLRNFAKKTCARASFLIKLQAYLFT